MRTLDEIRGLSLPPISTEHDISDSKVHERYKKIIENYFLPKDSKEAERYLQYVDMIVEENRNMFFDAVLAAKRGVTWNIEASMRSLLSWLSFQHFFYIIIQITL